MKDYPSNIEKFKAILLKCQKNVTKKVMFASKKSYLH